MKKKNAISPKFSVGDTVYYIGRAFTDEEKIYYCPECHGTGRVEVEFPAYHTKTLATCPLCLNRAGLEKDDLDRATGNSYRKLYTVGNYTVLTGTISAVYYEQNKTGISLNFLVKNEKYPGDSIRKSEKELYASEKECAQDIVKIVDKEKEQIDIYIGKKK